MLGIVITYVFGLVLKWFTPGAYVAASEDFAGFLGYLIAPCVAIALPRCAMGVKMLRSSVILRWKRICADSSGQRKYENRVMYHHV